MGSRISEGRQARDLTLEHPHEDSTHEGSITWGRSNAADEEVESLRGAFPAVNITADRETARSSEEDEVELDDVCFAHFL